MSRAIYGAVVGTGMNPDAFIEKTELVQQIEKNTEDIRNLSATVNDLKNNGTVTDEQIQNAVENYLEENPVGGGSTPVKGTDYWTEEDKAEIKSYVDEAILGGEW